MNASRPIPARSRNNGSNGTRRPAHRAAAFAFCVTAAGSAAPGWGAQTLHATQDAQVALRIEESAGVFQLHGAFATVATPDLAWQVLTDYEHIPQYIHSLKRCDLERRPDGQMVLNQAANAGSFPFRRTLHVALELHDDIAGRIGFRDTLGKDFKVYFGDWQTTADSTGTVVRYTLAVQPRTIVPHRLIRSAMSGGIRSYLSQMQAEMERRAALRPQAAVRVARSQPPR